MLGSTCNRLQLDTGRLVLQTQTRSVEDTAVCVCVCVCVCLPNVECVKSGLEVKVEWQYTHVGQTLHRLKDLCFLPLTGKRDRLTAVLQQDRTGVCVCVCVSREAKKTMNTSGYRGKETWSETMTYLQ